MNHKLVVVALAIAVMSSALGVIYTKHQSRGLFVELQALQRQRDNLEIEWGLLQLEQSTLATEIVVDQAARKRLEMAIPDPDSVVYITR
jgi:cell division protein FtsL